MSDPQTDLVAYSRTLKGMFFTVSFFIVVLIISACLVAINALTVSAADSRMLAKEHLVVMQDAQLLLQRTMMIEHKTHKLITGGVAEVDTNYDEITKLLNSIDSLVEGFGHATSGTAILDLHQASQVFRNLVHIIARLRRDLSNPEASAQQISKKQQSLDLFQQQLTQQIEALMITSEELSSRINFDYRQALDKLTTEIDFRQKIVLYMMLASLLLVLLTGTYYLRNTISRLHRISSHVRRGIAEYSSLSIPVQGHDEIGKMARDIEKLLEHYSQLKPEEVNQNSEQEKG